MFSLNVPSVLKNETINAEPAELAENFYNTNSLSAVSAASALNVFSAPSYVGMLPAICCSLMTTNSAGFSGAKPTMMLTMPMLMSVWVVVWLSHLTK